MQKTSSHKLTHDTCQQGTVATDKYKSPLSRGRHQLKDPGRWRRAGPVSFSSLQPSLVRLRVAHIQRLCDERWHVHVIGADVGEH